MNMKELISYNIKIDRLFVSGIIDNSTRMSEQERNITQWRQQWVESQRRVCGKLQKNVMTFTPMDLNLCASVRSGVGKLSLANTEKPFS